MAGAMRKMGIYLGLVEDEENRAQEGEYDEYDHYAEPARGTDRAAARATERTPSYAGYDRAAERAAVPERVTTPDRSTDRVPARSWHTDPVAAEGTEATRGQITTLHPRTYNEARQIGEHFRDGVPVIMNLTEMSDSDAKRLVDFAAGLSFGLRGSIERVTNKVFLLSPQNVTVTAEDKARIAEGGFFNQS
jgi:cell division inhibitor SepF